jgi:hypothetical protein
MTAVLSCRRNCFARNAIGRSSMNACDIGISSARLIREVYFDRRPVSKFTVKAHIWQINSELEQTDWIIASDRRRWFLQRRVQRKTEAAE